MITVRTGEHDHVDGSEPEARLFAEAVEQGGSGAAIDQDRFPVRGLDQDTVTLAYVENFYRQRIRNRPCVIGVEAEGEEGDDGEVGEAQEGGF